MDLGFFRRAEALLAGRTPARVDFGMLLAALRLHQAASAAARAQAISEALPCPEDPLAELLSGGSAWRRAAAALRGSFNPAHARGQFDAAHARAQFNAAHARGQFNAAHARQGAVN
jgi:hypothetical protein